ncbi:hypothetical protein GOD96_33320 [Sinorhizobium medicae]|nr:hypothetical protein [Sinorhizobium medicae]
MADIGRQRDDGVSISFGLPSLHTPTDERVPEIINANLVIGVRATMPTSRRNC